MSNEIEEESIPTPFYEDYEYTSCSYCGFHDCDVRDKGEKFAVPKCKVRQTWDSVDIENCGDDLVCRSCPDITGEGCKGKVIGIVKWERLTKDPWTKIDKEVTGQGSLSVWF